VRRFVLNTVTVSESVSVLQKMWGLDLGDYLRKGAGWPDAVRWLFFPFPDGSGFWMTYIPDKHGDSPPF